MMCTDSTSEVLAFSTICDVSLNPWGDDIGECRVECLKALISAQKPWKELCSQEWGLVSAIFAAR
ncbi:hypothetical protein BCR33DRAFT_714544, partial [Rhizoclosmatium globosum]